MSKPPLVLAWLGPGARQVKRHDLFVLALAERVYRVILDLPLTELPLTRALFTLRGIPHQADMTVGELFTTPPFRLLEEQEPTEIVFEIARPRFRAVANIRVEREGTGARLSMTTWVETWGWGATVRFALYWLVVGPFSGLIRWEMLRAARRRSELAE